MVSTIVFKKILSTVDTSIPFLQSNKADWKFIVWFFGKDIGVNILNHRIQT